MSVLAAQAVDPELARLRDSIDNFDAALIHLHQIDLRAREFPVGRQYVVLPRFGAHARLLDRLHEGRPGIVQ